MKLTTPLAAAALAAGLVIGGAGTAFAQEDDGPGTTDPARREFVCANLEQIQQLQVDHAALLEDRVALLQQARTAAEQNGQTSAVERIDRRIERSTERQAKVSERQQKLADYAAENCTG